MELRQKLVLESATENLDWGLDLELVLDSELELGTPNCELEQGTGIEPGIGNSNLEVALYLQLGTGTRKWALKTGTKNWDCNRNWELELGN